MPLPEATLFGQRWAEILGKDSLAIRVFATLSETSGALVAPLVDSTRRRNPVIDAVLEHDLVETQKHAAAHFRAITLLPTPRAFELGDDPLAFIRAHGIRRARANVPLNAVLQAYRTGHKGFWAAISEIINRLATSSDEGLRTTMLLSDYCIEYTDLISIAVTDAYIAGEAQLAVQRTRVSITVLEDLLRGEYPRTKDAVDLCERANIGDGQLMVVAVARRPPQANSHYPARERSMLAEIIEAALSTPDLGRFIELRLDEIVAIVSSRDAPGARVARALRQHAGILAGDRPSGAAIGIGLDIQSIAELPRCYTEAVAAIDIGGKEPSVVHLAEIPLDTYLRYKADETALRLAPHWAGTLGGGNLIETLNTFAACSLNVKACAAALKVHTNTIYHRLNRVQRLTGADPRTFAGLSQLLSALSIRCSAANVKG
jgi:hypothetical protein